MALPRCPACGSLIFPSARDGGDTSPLCEDCQESARKTGHAGPSLRFVATEVREEVIEPSGPFLLPRSAMPPDEVLEHLQAKASVAEPAPPAPKEVVVEPSGPFVVPGAPPPIALDEGAAPKEPIAAREPVTEEDDETSEKHEVVEPSGPFLAPAGSPPVSFEQAATPFASEPAAVVGIAKSATRRVPVTDPEAPSVVVEAALGGARMEATLELPRELRDALTPLPRAQTAWTALALAFAAGMLAGAALAIAVIKL